MLKFLHRTVWDGRTRALAAAASLLALAAYGAPAFAIAPGKPTTIGGVKAVCTGVGQTKNDPRWSAYPVRLIFADKKGQYTAGEKIAITKDGRTVIDTSCDAPWLLLKPEAGKYHVTATLTGAGGQRSTGADFSTNDKGPQKTVTLDFPMAAAG